MASIPGKNGDHQESQKRENGRGSRSAGMPLRPMILSQSQFFTEKLGVPLRNPRYSWGAFDPQFNQVFLRLWQNHIERIRNGERVLILGEDWSSLSNGYHERRSHIEALENGAQGIGVLCVPSDTSAKVWSIKSYDDELLLRLGDIEKDDGKFYAAITERFPISELTHRTISKESGLRSRKVTRVCFNSADWRRPTGEAKKLEGPGTFCHDHGFGHEEWLFRSEWQIDGWRYGFLQGVNDSYYKLVAAREPMDITLFTIQRDKRRRYVATIRNAECMDEQQAKAAVKAFMVQGWRDTMASEIKAVGGKVEALGNSIQAKDILNIRFRLTDVYFNKPDDFIEADDPAIHLHRYTFCDLANLGKESGSKTNRKRRAADLAPVAKPVFRRAIAGTHYTPEHRIMQAKLFGELKREFPNGHVALEENYIDVSVRTKSELVLYEIKSDLDPRAVIRQALGQILEYAFFTQRMDIVPIRLVLVGRQPLSAEGRQYIELLRKKFLLPVEYRVISI